MNFLQRHVARPARRGFSLIEVTVAMVILSVMMVAALRGLGSTARMRLADADSARREALARDMLGEVMQQLYEDPALDAGSFGKSVAEAAPGNRSLYDDVDDYHNWVGLPPQNKDGSVIANSAGWQRRVQVGWSPGPNLTDASGSDTRLKWIKVTVTDATGRKTKLYGLRSAHSSYEQQPRVESTYVGWVGIELQVGDQAEAGISGGVNIVNQLPLNLD